ncbi:MAG: hypothetical protein HY842_04865 [Bacteroidetes bacterium]|nr:hypothetical protein [Bacteroidota bacterium]
MKQTSTTNAPIDFSPEFTEWLVNEKADARRHQMRILKASLLIAIGSILFLLKQQPEWIAGIFDLGNFAAG